MKYLNTSLAGVALAFLICLVSPYSAQAQDDGTMPWCDHVIIRHCLSQPIHVVEHFQDGSPIPLVNYALAQYGDSNSRPHDTAIQEDFLLPQLSSNFAGILSSAGNDIRDQCLLFDDRRQEPYLIRRQLENTQAASA